MRNLFIFTLIAFIACQDRSKPASGSQAYDTTTLPATDTVISYRVEPDSTELKRYMDSIFSIQPVAVFTGDQNATAFQKLVDAFIDTSGVKRLPLHFSDTVIYKYNKDQEPVSSREISRSKRFTVEVHDEMENGNDPERKIFVNGKRLRAGIELDTSLAGDFYLYNFELSPKESCLLRFGKKEYLYLQGISHNCNGRACSVSFHILYDQATGRGMVNEQYLMDLAIGYDRKNNCPVILESNQEMILYDAGSSVMYSGKLYRWTPESGPRPALNRKRNPILFKGFQSNGRDTLLLTSAVFPDH